MKFPYKKFTLLDGTELLKPIIPIGLLFNGRRIKYEALIDSGADFNIFHAEIGELLGLKVRSGKKTKFSGIVGEPFEVYFHNVTIEVGRWRHKILAGFSYDVSPYGFGILGQRGFFDLFQIKFLFTKRIIEITSEKR